LPWRLSFTAPATAANKQSALFNAIRLSSEQGKVVKLGI
jgi:hypothetical protein